MLPKTLLFDDDILVFWLMQIGLRFYLLQNLPSPKRLYEPVFLILIVSAMTGKLHNYIWYIIISHLPNTAYLPQIRSNSSVESGPGCIHHCPLLTNNTYYNDLMMSFINVISKIVFLERALACGIICQNTTLFYFCELNVLFLFELGL